MSSQPADIFSISSRIENAITLLHWYDYYKKASNLIRDIVYNVKIKERFDLLEIFLLGTGSMFFGVPVEDIVRDLQDIVKTYILSPRVKKLYLEMLSEEEFWEFMKDLSVFFNEIVLPLLHIGYKTYDIAFIIVQAFTNPEKFKKEYVEYFEYTAENDEERKKIYECMKKLLEFACDYGA